MTNPVALANLALTQVGGQRIVSLSEDDTGPLAFKDILPFARRSELQANAWSFATTRAELSAETTAPAFGYDYSYVIPGQAIRMWQVHDGWDFWYVGNDIGTQRPPFTIEGRKILTDLGAPLRVRYVFDEKVVTNWSPLFQMAVGTKIARDIAYKLSDTAALQDRLDRLYKETIHQAILANAIELPPQHKRESSWVLARAPGIPPPVWG